MPESYECPGNNYNWSQKKIVRSSIIIWRGPVHWSLDETHEITIEINDNKVLDNTCCIHNNNIMRIWFTARCLAKLYQDYHILTTRRCNEIHSSILEQRQILPGRYADVSAYIEQTVDFVSTIILSFVSDNISVTFLTRGVRIRMRETLLSKLLLYIRHSTRARTHTTTSSIHWLRYKQDIISSK